MAGSQGDERQIQSLLDQATDLVRRGRFRAAHERLRAALAIDRRHREVKGCLVVLERYLRSDTPENREPLQAPVPRFLRRSIGTGSEGAPREPREDWVRAHILDEWRRVRAPQTSSLAIYFSGDADEPRVEVEQGGKKTTAHARAIIMEPARDDEQSGPVTGGDFSDATLSGSSELAVGTPRPDPAPSSGTPNRLPHPASVKPGFFFNGPRPGSRIPIHLENPPPSSVFKKPASSNEIFATTPPPAPQTSAPLHLENVESMQGGEDDARGVDSGWNVAGKAPDTSKQRPFVQPQRLSLGVADEATPLQPLTRHTLAAGKRHLLWVEIAPELAAGALHAPEALQGLREGDVLDVIVFAFPKQLELEGKRHGRIQLHDGGNQVVKRAWRSGITRAAASRPRLFFAFSTPEQPGRYALRCNIYCRGVLLQSHLVRTHVTEQRREQQGALTALVDYNLSSSLSGGRLPPERDCRVSLFINDDGRGTHSFRFVSSKDGVPEHIGDGHLEGVQLANMVKYAREALRWTAWGTKAAWSGEPCQFGDLLDQAKLEAALLMMAKRGANLWMQLSAAFAFVGPGAMTLREHMRHPGRVQIALKDSPDAIIPIALIYDYPFDPAKRNVKLCPAALAAIVNGKKLVDEPCFHGECPSYADRGVVCPGGFWGFRHDLGLPLHLAQGEVATSIPRGPALRAFAPISTDPAFSMRDEHLEALGKLAPSWLEVLRDRESCLERLKEARQLIYFYCHGGVTDADTPFLRVGDLKSEDIFAATLVDAGISWTAPLRPLVILNGCHTTATSPDAMFSMLTAFASHCNAAGIIGTEITNFELIAGIFASEFLRNFLGTEPESQLLGRAVRLGRLALLAKGNPLGLMYIPFALPGLRLE